MRQIPRCSAQGCSTQQVTLSHLLSNNKKPYFMNNLSNQPVTLHNQNLIILMEWFLFEDTNISSVPAANGLIWLFRQPDTT